MTAWDPDDYERAEREALRADRPSIRPERLEPSGCGCDERPRRRCDAMRELTRTVSRTWSQYVTDGSLLALRTHERAAQRVVAHRAAALGYAPSDGGARHTEPTVKLLASGYAPGADQ